jgi:uncharacterized membrane protein YphA (DoxX/SURF4 family)
MPSTAPGSDSANRPKAWNVSLWVVQIVLASAFGIAGIMKAALPISVLAQNMGWPGAVPPALVRFIGVSELAGAIGLILPAATRIGPMLTPLAGAGLVVVMVLAAAFHLSRGEFDPLPINFTLGALAAFVGWGRLKLAPIHRR